MNLNFNVGDINKIDGADFRVIFDWETIQKNIREIAKIIKADYTGCSPPVLLFVAMGGVYLGTFLSQALDDIGFDHITDIIRLKSYDGENQGKIEILNKPVSVFFKRNIIVVEDLVDTGNSIEFLNAFLESEGAGSIDYCVLLEKGKHDLSFDISYKIFKDILNKDAWLVGLGMDNLNLFRGLRCVIQKIL